MAHYHLFIAAGQSNLSAYSPIGTLKGSGLITQPTHPGTAPDYIPTSDQIASQEWTGSPAASLDSGVQYPYPTSGANPCLYVENTRGLPDGIFDAWGAFDKQSPLYPSGTPAVVGSYGLELSFLAKVRQAHPTWNLACIKVALGGTGLHNDWLPNTVVIGTARGGTSNTITLAANNFINPATSSLRIRINSGTGAGQERTASAYDGTTKVVTVTANWDTPPDTTSTYGVERLQSQILRNMYELAAARFAAAGHTFEAEAFIWMHGENGAHGAAIALDDSQYLSDARGLFAWMRSLTSTPDLPVLIGRIGDNWTNANPYLIAAGYPWAAIDYSLNNTDGRIAQPQDDRDGCLAGALARRATQATLGSDDNCIMWDNDGYPPRPPYGLTASLNDVTGYHWGHPGNLSAGERAFAVFDELTAPAAPSTSKLFITTSAGVLVIGV